MPSVIESFNAVSNKPNFDRDIFATVADMVAFSERRLPDMYIANVKETGLTYKYKKTNSIDPILGKWRVFDGNSVIDAIAVNGIDSVSLTIYIGKYLFDIKNGKVYYVTVDGKQNVTANTTVNRVSITQQLYDKMGEYQKNKNIIWLIDD